MAYPRAPIIDRQLLKFILLIYFFAGILNISNAALCRFQGLDIFPEYWVSLYSILLGAYIGRCILLTIAIVITSLFVHKKTGIFPSLLFHLFMAINYTAYTTFFSLLSRRLYTPDCTYQEMSIYEFVFQSLGRTEFCFFTYFAFVIVVYAHNYFRTQQAHQSKEARLKNQLLDSKIKALQSQLQPHFLFNTLNDISSLMDIDVKKSQLAIADLSAMLRQTLRLKNARFIQLDEELELLKKYMDIEKMRYDKKLNFQIKVNPVLYTVKIPPLLLQPILENAIKHGFSYDHDELMIQIRIFEQQDFICFEISNNGQLLAEEAFTPGTGLSNILERIDTLYNHQFTFEMVNNTAGNGVTTFIQLPKSI